MPNKLINTAALSALVESNQSIEATAKPFTNVDGYFLAIQAGDEELVLSTYLTDKPRLFKRSDALLKEAKSIGLVKIVFDMSQS